MKTISTFSLDETPADDNKANLKKVFGQFEKCLLEVFIKHEIIKKYEEYFPGGDGYAGAKKSALSNSPESSTRLLFVYNVLLLQERYNIKDTSTDENPDSHVALSDLECNLAKLESTFKYFYGYKRIEMFNVFLVYPSNFRVAYDTNRSEVRVATNDSKGIVYNVDKYVIGKNVNRNDKVMIQISGLQKNNAKMRIDNVTLLNADDKSRLISRKDNKHEFYVGGNQKVYGLSEEHSNVVYYPISRIEIIGERNSVGYLMKFEDGVQMFFKKNLDEITSKSQVLFKINSEMLPFVDKYACNNKPHTITHASKAGDYFVIDNRPTKATIFYPNGNMLESEVAIHFWELKELYTYKGGIVKHEVYFKEEELFSRINSYSYPKLCELYYFFDIYSMFCDVPKLFRDCANSSQEVFNKQSLKNALRDGLHILSEQSAIDPRFSKSVINFMKLVFLMDTNDELDFVAIVEQELNINRHGVGAPSKVEKNKVLAGIMGKIKEHNSNNPADLQFHKVYSDRLMDAGNFLKKDSPEEVLFMKILLVLLCMTGDNKKKFLNRTGLTIVNWPQDPSDASE